MLSFGLLLTSLLPLASSSPIVSRDADAAITSVSFSGSGCTQGSNSASISGSFNNANLKFSQFSSSSANSDSDNCAVHFQGAGAPAGWQVALDESNASGSVSLKPSTKFSYFTTSFWSDDAADTLVMSNNVTCGSDPVDRSFSIHSKADRSVWSKCVGADGNPGILTVNLRVALHGAGSYKVDSENLKFKWRQC